MAKPDLKVGPQAPIVGEIVRDLPPSIEYGVEGTFVDSMIEIGEILLRRGKDSAHRANPILSGRLDENSQTLTIPLSNGNELNASIARPIRDTGSLLEPRININVTALAPTHYKRTTTTLKSLSLFGKKPWQKDHEVGVQVNKVLEPEAKDLEQPERGKNYEPYHYKNKDGEDVVEINASPDRLGEKTRTFADRFAAWALKQLRDYDEAETAKEKAAAQSEPDQITGFIASGNEIVLVGAK